MVMVPVIAMYTNTIAFRNYRLHFINATKLGVVNMNKQKINGHHLLCILIVHMLTADSLFIGNVRINQWCHDECDGVSSHRRLHCVFNRLFRRRLKKISKLRATGLCEGKSPVTFPHKGPVTRKGRRPIIYPTNGLLCFVSLSQIHGR